MALYSEKELKNIPVIDDEIYRIIQDTDKERAQRILDLQRRLESLEEQFAKLEGI